MDLSVLNKDPAGLEAEAIIKKEKLIEETVYKEREKNYSYGVKKGWEYLKRKTKTTDAERMRDLELEERDLKEQQEFIKRKELKNKEFEEKTAKNRLKRLKRKQNKKK